MNHLNVGIAHGAAYGPGIYTSPFFDKAMSYTAATNEEYVYMIVNFLLFGKLKLIAPTGMISKHKPVNGMYEDSSHTKIVFGMEQLISADPARVFPIAVIKIRIK